MALQHALRPSAASGPPGSPVRWGILSTARINELVLAGARQSDRVRILAIASRSEERAGAYARKHAIERAYGSYEALLQDPDVEAVYISLPNALHLEWTIRALEAGKHVLCEKPLARKLADAEQAFVIAERAGRFLMEGFMWRHHPQTLLLQDLVESGTIGQLRLIRADFSFEVDDPNDARLVDVLGGGSLMDVGCYCVNAARMLAGEPELVYGEQVTNNAGVDLCFAGTLRFPSDVLCVFDSALHLPVREELEVVGSDGSLFLPDPWHMLTPVIEVRRHGSTERIEVEVADSYRLELENLSDAIRGVGKQLLGRDDAVGQGRLLEALYRSAEERRPISLVRA